MDCAQLLRPNPSPRKRLSIDVKIPEYVMQRRGGISFGSTSSSSIKSLPRLGRRGALSFDKADKNAVYVRQLGDVRARTAPEIIHQHLVDTLPNSDKTCLRNLADPDYKTRCGERFLTMSGVTRHRRPQKGSTSSRNLLDDFYNSQTKCLLERVSDWSFDVFSLDEASNGRPLFYVMVTLFQKHNLMQQFDLDIVKLMKFASLVEEGYHGNPYHNAIHAADVTQAMHCYIMQQKIAKHLTPLETLTCLLSAITHDLDHPGVNQAFLIATNNHLAALYKNNSVLENHHWRTAVGMLYESKLLEHLPFSSQEQIFKQMKSLILATDMTRQQEFYSRLRKTIEDDALDMQSNEDRHFVLQIALKCADISNPSRPWHTCRAWSGAVCDEFFQQGDYERKLKLPITNLCDRFIHTVPKIQTGFIDFVVNPLFREFNRFLQCALVDEQIHNIENNRLSWEDIHIQQTTPLIVETPPLHDINCNISVGKSVGQSDGESDIESVLSSPGSSNGAEYRDELPNDIHDVQTDIALVAERLEWADEGTRRASLPTDRVIQSDLCIRRESFPLVQGVKRITLPHTKVYQAISFDRLVEKLTYLEELAPSNRARLTGFNIDNLLSEPRLSTLSPSIETSKITKYKLIANKIFNFKLN